MNSQYLMNMNLNTIAKIAQPYYIDQGLDISDEKKYLQIVDNARQRVNTLIELPRESKMFYGKVIISLDNLDLVYNDTAQILLKSIYSSIIKETNCDGERFKAIVIEIGNSVGVKGKKLFPPVRTALYGDPKGPDIPLIFSILGIDETLNRLSQVIK